MSEAERAEAGARRLPRSLKEALEALATMATAEPRPPVGRQERAPRKAPPKATEMASTAEAAVGVVTPGVVAAATARSLNRAAAVVVPDSTPALPPSRTVQTQRATET